MRVGLGTGSTVHFTIVALGERKPDIICAATSERTRALATELGLRVVPPDELLELDIAIDGADEVDARFNLIKGGGGAHLREKIIAAMARRFIVVVDEAKLVETLGAFPLPLEVLPFAPGGRRGAGAGARRARGHHARGAQRQRQPADGRGLRSHRRSGAAGRAPGGDSRHRRARALPRRRWSSAWSSRAPTACASWCAS